jgi:hypothetical protein
MHIHLDHFDHLFFFKFPATGILSSTYSLLKHTKERISKLTNDSIIRQSTDTFLRLNEISYLNTSKAWEELKYGNFDTEPESVTFTSDDIDQYYELPMDSERSTPKHGIQYINEAKVSFCFKFELVSQIMSVL